MITLTKGSDVKYQVKLDYDTDCSECDDNDYHRNCSIQNIVVSIDPYYAVQLSGYEDSTPMNKLLAFLFFRWVFNPINVDVTTCGGYYGDEIDKVTIGNSGDIDHFNDLLAQNRSDLIVQMIMNKHYNYIRPEILAVKEWKLESVSIKELDIMESTIKKADLRLYKSHIDQHTKDAPWFPGCIAIPSSNKFKIIDGFHRLKAYLDHNPGARKIKVLIPK